MAADIRCHQDRPIGGGFPFPEKVRTIRKVCVGVTATPAVAAPRGPELNT